MFKREITATLMFAILLLMATGTDAFSQRGRGMDRMGGMEQVCPSIPNLTDEQSQQITQLRTAHLKEMQSLRDQIDVNRAQYRQLMRGDRADMNAINANIDERSAIRTQMEKKQAAHHQSIRGLLTEEQRVWFDAAPRGPMGRGAGMRAAPGRGEMRQAAPRGGRGGGAPGVMPNRPGSRRGF